MILLAKLLLEVPLELLVQLAAEAHGSLELVADYLHYLTSVAFLLVRISYPLRTLPINLY